RTAAHHLAQGAVRRRAGAEGHRQGGGAVDPLGEVPHRGGVLPPRPQAAGARADLAGLVPPPALPLRAALPPQRLAPHPARPLAAGRRGVAATRGAGRSGVVDYSSGMSAPRIAPAHSLPIADARERLRELIRDLAVVRGHVVLSSGAEADHYVDLRRITLHHEAAPLVGRVMLDLLRREGLVPGVEAVGGLTLGADPVATSILHASAADEDLDPLDAFVVRKANKAHGLQRRIEGPDVTGRR